MDEILSKYLKLVYPQPLLPDEYIRVMAKNDAGMITRFIQTFEDFELFVITYRGTHDIWNTVSTVKGNTSGESENMYRRQVICLDFDAKDFPDLGSPKEHLSRVKGILPSLFNHCSIMSGSGGVHLYIAIKSTEDLDRVQKITAELGVILKSDPQALKKTQNLRPPRSLNHKHEPPVFVNVFRNEYGTKRYRPYTLDALQGIINRYRREIELEEKKPVIDEINRSFRINTRHYPCVEKMLADGPDKIEKDYRNFALCRIVKMLQKRAYTKEKVAEVALEWNQRKCEPPKRENEIRADVDSIWEKDYRLLGCTDKIPNHKHRAFLERYCDRHTCLTATICGQSADADTVPALLRQYDLKSTPLRELTGYQYLILCILHRNRNGLTYKGIEAEMLCKQTRKPCATEKTIRTALTGMTGKYITKKGTTYRIKSTFCATGVITFSYAICVLLINKLITQADFKVFLAMLRCVHQEERPTLERIADMLRSDKSNVRKSIKNLEDAHAVKSNLYTDERGINCRRYHLLG